MRIMSRIVFSMEPLKARKILSPYGLPIKITHNVQDIFLDTNTSLYIDLNKLLNDLNIDFSELKEYIYSVEEIETAELLRMIPDSYCGYPQPDINRGFREMSFDVHSACNNCLNGMLQIKPLRIIKPRMNKNDISGIHWIYEYVLSAKLKRLIMDEKLTGCDFWPLLDYKNQTAFDEYSQLFITNVMPKMSSKAKIIKTVGFEPCSCGKKGFALEGVPVYERRNFGEIKDFNKTTEWLGGIKTTWQLPIVSQRVYSLFKKHKISGVRFEPVMVL